jgi:hypothetical protein
MKITPIAVKSLLEIMDARGLNTKEWCLEIRILDNGVVGIGFNKVERDFIFGDLGIAIDERVDTEGLLIDLGEIDGKKGLIFSSEQE